MIMYIKQIIKKIIRPRAGTMMSLCTGLLFVVAMLAHQSARAQTVCEADLTVSFTAAAPSIGSNGGQFTVMASDIDNGSSGTLVGVSFTAGSYTGLSITGLCSDYPSGEAMVYLFANDGGSVTSCSTLVEIIDNDAPVIDCLNPTISLDMDGLAVITTDMVGVVYENCNTSNFSIVGADMFDCHSLGSPTSVVLTASDDAGNSTSTTCSFTLVDDMNPVASCNQNINFYSSDFIAGLQVSDVDNGSIDNCGCLLYTSDAADE